MTKERLAVTREDPRAARVGTDVQNAAARTQAGDDRGSH